MKKIISKLVLATLLVTLMYTPSSAYASEESYLWNESNGEMTQSDSKMESETIYYEDEYSELDETAEDVPALCALPVSTFQKFSLTSTTEDYKAKYVGSTRVDNTNNAFTSAELLFTASQSGTWSVGAELTFEGQGELNAIITKIDLTVSLGATVSRSWTNGYTYGVSVDVPAGKVGKVEAYIPGTKTTGYLVYNMYNPNNHVTSTVSMPVDKTIPSKNEWNMVVVVEEG